MATAIPFPSVVISVATRLPLATALTTACVSWAGAGVETIKVGNGNNDVVYCSDFYGGTISVGNGNADVVTNSEGDNNRITLGNGNGDVVNDFTTNQSFPSNHNNTIMVGKGNDTIYVGSSDTITVGTGHDRFIFEQTAPGSIGAVTVNHFNPSQDVFTFLSLLTTSVSYHDNAQDNAVVTVDKAGDTVTLVGVHSSALHPSDFHFV